MRAGQRQREKERFCLQPSWTRERERKKGLCTMFSCCALFSQTDEPAGTEHLKALDVSVGSWRGQQLWNKSLSLFFFFRIPLG